MPVLLTPRHLHFPPPHFADTDGLLALGGDLRTERLLDAYRRGIFPWPDGPRLYWYCPDPRFVLFPAEFRLGQSARRAWKKHRFSFSINRDFRSVIRQCKSVPRPGQAGTWITDELEQAYLRLHEQGYAQSVEVWDTDGCLAGGLYGVRIGRVFFGESMFSLQPDASRCGFIFWVERLRLENTELIDCQVYTPYLESFGARMIPRDEFLRRVKEAAAR